MPGWCIDQLQAVARPDLFLERRKRDFGLERILAPPAAGECCPISLSHKRLAVEGAVVEILQQVGSGVAEALHLVAYPNEEVILRVARGEVRRCVEDFGSDLAAARERIDPDREARVGEFGLEVTFDAPGERREIVAGS